MSTLPTSAKGFEMIHIVTGNEFEVKKFTSQLVNKFVQDHGDLAIERIDGEEISTGLILDAIQGVSLLVDSKLCIITNPSKEFLELLADGIEVPETTEVIIVIPKIDKRASYYKKLVKLKGYQDFAAVSVRDLAAWVVDATKAAGGQISRYDAQYLVDRVGANQLILKSEIEKLTTSDAHITKRLIDELCEPTPQSSVFQLVDAAFAGKLEESKKLYQEQRAQRVEAHAILGMIAWQLHVLAIVKAAEMTTVRDVASEAKLSPFVVRKSQPIARKLSMEQIKRLIAQAKELDTSLKSEPIDSDQAMQTFLVSLAGR